MEVETRVVDVPANIILLQVSGRVTTGSLPPLEKELDKYAEGPPVKLILDLQKVEGIDSQGVGILIKARFEIVNRGGKLVLLGPSDRVKTVLRISGLDEYFLIAPTESSALSMLDS